MDRLRKKLEELEMIQNNIKLLSELLSHYNPASGDTEKLLMKVSNANYPIGRPVRANTITLYPMIT